MKLEIELTEIEVSALSRSAGEGVDLATFTAAAIRAKIKEHVDAWAARDTAELQANIARIPELFAPARVAELLGELNSAVAADEARRRREVAEAAQQSGEDASK